MDGAAAATGQKITGFCNNWYTLDTLWSFAVITSFLLNQLSILINRVSVSWLLVYSSRSVHFKILSLMGEPIKLSVDGFILVLTLSWWIFNVSKLSMCGPGTVCVSAAVSKISPNHHSELPMVGRHQLGSRQNYSQVSLILSHFNLNIQMGSVSRASCKRRFAKISQSQRRPW